MSIKKLTLIVSQDCETKQGAYSYSGKKFTVDFDNATTVGKVVGGLVDRFFDFIEVTKKAKQCPYKLSHPIQFNICYQDNDWLNAKLSDETKIECRISNTRDKNGENRMAVYLVDLLGVIAKSNQDRPDLKQLVDNKRMSLTDAGRALCDEKMMQVAKY